MLKKLILLIILAAAIFSLAGCQTIQGVGRDITWLAGGSNGSVRR